ncbi:type II toxin-antitoxin system HicB family antitoxin [Marinactinospora rubrisoli]|uniref:Type II toxin-antitoxin system HicB family antitoxin n=1 Tax=Marinactinospora rubrisoli TaxID=2715399 RepID=A0ABW2KMR6_9ACTN
MNDYLVLIERTPDGYGAWCPDLLGCVALGDTVEETIAEMQEAIQFHLEGMREEGLPIPAPTTVTTARVATA